jgi:hypothetical protein
VDTFDVEVPSMQLPLRERVEIPSSAMTVMRCTMARLLKDARLSERIGAIVFDAQTDTRCEEVLKEYGLALGKSSPQPRNVGRPAGSKRGLECRYFVYDLLTVVAKAGGKLTFDKNHGGGTLPSALELIAPFLPPPMVEGKFSPSLLAEVCASWRKDIGQIIDRRHSDKSQLSVQ